jgi:hypothetical protein
MSPVSHSYQQHRQRHRPMRAQRSRSGTCTIRVTLDTRTLKALRRLAMRVCGEVLEFIRIGACDGARMQVSLCMRLRAAARLCDAIACQLPGALMLPSSSYLRLLR